MLFSAFPVIPGAGACTKEETQKQTGAAHLQESLLNHELAVHTTALFPAHFLQLLLIEGEELGPGQDSQALHDPRGRWA